MRAIKTTLTCALFAACVLRGQTSPMRTRYLPSLTNQYLKRNFIPVGTVESFGTMPSDMEYRMAEAYAVRLAEEADGLVLPHVIYFYPGVTVTVVASVYIPQEIGLAYLKALAKSPLRQGFRRQVYLSAHGPSDQYVSGMVRQFFEETKDPILYIHLSLLNQPESGGASSFRSIGYGAYYLLGERHSIGSRPAGARTACPAQAARISQHSLSSRAREQRGRQL